jgi:exodeoxyribonuclease VII large subunit
MKVEPLLYGDRKVYTVAGFNRGVSDWLARLPTLWIEGEVTELRRSERWGSVFFTLKDPEDGACLPASIPRRTFDALKLELAEGERIHVLGRPELFAAKGEFRLRALSLERFGLGAHLAAIERLKQTLAAEGLFDAARKRPLPRFPRRIGLVTGTDAAARRDVITTIQTRFPPARVLVAETLVQGPRAAAGIVEALEAVAREPRIDVIVLTRGGGSFDDLLPFSDERVVRAVAGCPVPVVSAVGHEQDTPLCDLAADVRASTPTAAGKLVVPDFEALRVALDRARGSLERSVRRPRARRPAGTRARSASSGRARRAAATRARAPRGAEAVGARADGRPVRGALAACDSGARLRDRPRRRRRPAQRCGDRRGRAGRGRARGGRLRRPRRGRAAVTELTFESAQRELEEIVERLERGNAELDEAIKLWERGEELLRFCLERLETAEGRVEELARRAGGTDRLPPPDEAG